MLVELPSDWLVLLVPGTVLLLLYVAKRPASSKGLPLPPGPSPMPFIGNLLDIPTSAYPEHAYRDMNAKYSEPSCLLVSWPNCERCSSPGDIVYLNALGQHTVILGTHETAVELLEKRSSITSDQVCPAMINL